MNPNRYKLAAVHYWMRSETRKVTEISLHHGAFLAVLILVISAISCNREYQPVTESELPEHIQNIENVTLIDPFEGAVPDSMELIQETVFESSEDVFMSGNISNFAVDDAGRVFVVSSVPGHLGVYVFNSDGTYLTTIGRYGQGPGEFEALGAIDVLEDELILFDPRLQKFAVYSLNDFEKTEEKIINLSEATRINQMPAIAKGTDLKLLNNDGMVLEVGMSSLNEESDGTQIFYYKLQRDGTINPERLLEVDRHKRYFLPEREGWAIPITKPFNRSSLVSITQSGTFFTAWTEDFLIKEYDTNGDYIQSLYYPITKSDLSLDQISIADHERRMLRGEEIPDTWPALHTMELDDEGRLWIATITDSKTHFTWQVLNQKGEWIARFQKEGERSRRFVPSKPLIIIKNGYFYTHQREFRQGIDRIIKYKIQRIER
ncbi:6-bladed beta-propeller [Rhodohalobacter sp. SW132]|uniref:6-bladed beta-propeller n=1 Tax=Rhodohalobacter sp. SW132 TaxID=2293433 RepID=UPI000E21C4B8|nr:6-bladed beta-propeller [Rhodohalobacter sp. SW132]REL37776.1 6-bladed beta-propeller [Rhodohalobacter sp. SW132]